MFGDPAGAQGIQRDDLSVQGSSPLPPSPGSGIISILWMRKLSLQPKLWLCAPSPHLITCLLSLHPGAHSPTDTNVNKCPCPSPPPHPTHTPALDTQCPAPPQHPLCPVFPGSPSLFLAPKHLWVTTFLTLSLWSQATCVCTSGPHCALEAVLGPALLPKKDSYPQAPVPPCLRGPSRVPSRVPKQHAPSHLQVAGGWRKESEATCSVGQKLGLTPVYAMTVCNAEDPPER